MARKVVKVKKITKSPVVQPITTSTPETNTKKTKPKSKSPPAQSTTTTDTPLTQSEQPEQPTEQWSQIAEALGQGVEITDFKALPLHPSLQDVLANDFQFTKMTKIQQRCIPPLLAGKDVLGQAKTGSGKTLAFVLPAVENMVRSNFKTRNGTAVIIISPIRELCTQIHGVVAEVLKKFPHTHGAVTGGANPAQEVDKLTKGVTVLVATPGRLLDHLKNCKTFIYHNLQMLIIDEADRILQQGFADELNQIIRLLPKQRQTALFSATMTTKMEDLNKVAFPTAPMFIGVEQNEAAPTNEQLKQGYVVVPSDKRFLLLRAFLQRNLKKKTIVFFSSCNATKYYSDLLNYISIPVMELHGKLKQARRQYIFKEFINSPTGILLCTDVAARGLDIPAVDWIIQYDPPDRVDEYIHRVGRTARAGKSGNAILFLLPEELGWLKYLKASKVEVEEYHFPQEKVKNGVQEQLDSLVSKVFYLDKAARDGFRAYIQAYHTHSMKDVYNVNNLDLKKVMKSFCLSSIPAVNLKYAESAQNKRKAPAGGFSKKGDWGTKRRRQDEAPQKKGKDGRQWCL